MLVDYYLVFIISLVHFIFDVFLSTNSVDAIQLNNTLPFTWIMLTRLIGQMAPNLLSGFFEAIGVGVIISIISSKLQSKDDLNFKIQILTENKEILEKLISVEENLRKISEKNKTFEKKKKTQKMTKK